MLEKGPPTRPQGKSVEGTGFNVAHTGGSASSTRSVGRGNQLRLWCLLHMPRQVWEAVLSIPLKLSRSGYRQSVLN